MSGVDDKITQTLVIDVRVASRATLMTSQSVTVAKLSVHIRYTLYTNTAKILFLALFLLQW